MLKRMTNQIKDLEKKTGANRDTRIVIFHNPEKEAQEPFSRCAVSKNDDWSLCPVYKKETAGLCREIFVFFVPCDKCGKPLQ